MMLAGRSHSPAAVRTPSRSWLPTLALFAFATAWNLTKPYHVDDTAYLEIAQWIAAHPLHPMQGSLFWGDVPGPIPGNNQPHLYLYLMALWASVFGWSELAMHSLMALCALAAIALMHRLALLVVGDRATLATALVAASPAFVVGQNTMLDVPVLALWLLCFVTLLAPRAPHESERARYLAAGLACGAAILVKYTSLVLVPALVIDGVLRRRPEAAYGVAAAAVVVAAWCAFNYWDYGGVHMLTRVADNGGWHVLDPSKWVLCLGATAPFALALAAAYPPPSRRMASAAAKALWIAVIGVVALSVASFLGFIGREISDVAFATFFVASGTALVALAVRGLLPLRKISTPSNVAKLMLAYWGLSAAAFVVLLAPFNAVRHVLLALPPLVLLAVMAIPAGANRRWPIAAVAITLAVTSLVASADRWYARIYRDAAIRLRAAVPASANVWTVGHWGWQWYAREQGMNQIVPGESRPAPGDFVVYPERVHSQSLPAGLAISELHRMVVTPGNRVQALAAPNAGFYATTTFHQLPWAVHREPIEVFHVLRVDATADK